jgi:hypothetical protein
VASELLTLWHRVGKRTGCISLSSDVGIGSNLQDLEFPERITFSSSFSLMGLKLVNLGMLELDVRLDELSGGANSFLYLAGEILSEFVCKLCRTAMCWQSCLFPSEKKDICNFIEIFLIAITFINLIADVFGLCK